MGNRALRSVRSLRCPCPDPSIVFRGERVGEIHRNRLDITKARECLGFHPEVDLQKGLESLFSDEKKLV